MLQCPFLRAPWLAWDTPCVGLAVAVETVPVGHEDAIMKHISVQTSVPASTTKAVTKALSQMQYVDLTVAVLNWDMCARDVSVGGLALVIELPVPLGRHNGGDELPV